MSPLLYVSHKSLGSGLVWIANVSIANKLQQFHCQQLKLIVGLGLKQSVNRWYITLVWPLTTCIVSMCAVSDISAMATEGYWHNGFILIRDTSLSKDIMGPISRINFPLQFKFDEKFIPPPSKYWQKDCFKILHIALQLCCYGLWKIL